MFSLYKVCTISISIKKKLDSSKTYTQTSKDIKYIIYNHTIFSLSCFRLILKGTRISFIRCNGYRRSIKRLYKARFIAYPSSCTTNELSKLLTSWLTSIKTQAVKYRETVYMKDPINIFFLCVSIKIWCCFK